MDVIKNIVDIFLHLDEYLTDIIDKFGNWSYVILFLIIFAETGLVVAPFLPGDSLLFAAGALAATDAFEIVPLYLTLVFAAILGDTLNYSIGHKLGKKAFELNTSLLKQEYLYKAQAFYEKHGGKAIFLARFFPIIRTFAPFVAGVGKMTYHKFIVYNVLGAISWVSLFTFAGYFFGNITAIKDNFHYAVVVIILVSAIPLVVEFIKSRQKDESPKHENIGK